MAERSTSHWDVYDWLDIAEYNRWERHCPKCGGNDFKYAIHDPEKVGVGLSVLCNSCKHSDRGSNSGDDAERLVRDWHNIPAYNAINPPLIAR